MRCYVALLMTACLTSAVSAEVYHVDSRRGDDDAAGTAHTDPWRTLERVNAASLEPGDFVLFAADSSFDGQLAPTDSGEPGRPITFGMYGKGDAPRLDGHGRVGSVVKLHNVEHVVVQDLHLTNYGETREANRFGIEITLDNFGDARGIIVRRLLITDINGTLVKKGGGKAISFENRGEEAKSRFVGLVIEDNHIRRAERNAIGSASGYTGRGNWHPNLGVVIRRNLIEEVPGDGIVPIGCDGALIEGNVIRHGTPLLRQEHSAAAGIWPWSSDNTLIQYNEVSGHRSDRDGQGFDADWNCRGTVIQYNYSHHNDGGFLLVCNDGGAKGSWTVGNTGTIVRHNVSFDDGLREVDADTPGGQRAAAINVNGPVNGVEIYGNVIVAPSKASDLVDDEFVIATGWKGFPSGIVVRDNVIIAEGPMRFDLTRASGVTFNDNRLIGDVSMVGAGSAVEAADASAFAFPGDGVERGLELLDCYDMGQLDR